MAIHRRGLDRLTFQDSTIVGIKTALDRGNYPKDCIVLVNTRLSKSVRMGYTVTQSRADRAFMRVYL